MTTPPVLQTESKRDETHESSQLHHLPPFVLYQRTFALMRLRAEYVQKYGDLPYLTFDDAYRIVKAATEAPSYRPH